MPRTSLPAVFCNPDFLLDYPFSAPFGLAAAATDHPPLSSLEYITNVSFVNYLALVLCINFFLSPPSCSPQVDPSLPLITLVRRLLKLFLLVYDFFQSLHNNMPTADADAESVNTIGLGFDKLYAIFVHFGAPWKNLTVAKLFDVAYAQNLPDLDDLFRDGATQT